MASGGLVLQSGEVIPLYPPKPGEEDAWRRILEIEPSLEPSVCDMADELAVGVDRRISRSRINQLRLLGNGVVPSSAALAFSILLAEAVNGSQGVEEVACGAEDENGE
jgi:DNA (cytosine-5)-methyltransferase 1